MATVRSQPAPSLTPPPIPVGSKAVNFLKRGILDKIEVFVLHLARLAEAKAMADKATAELQLRLADIAVNVDTATAARKVIQKELDAVQKRLDKADAEVQGWTGARAQCLKEMDDIKKTVADGDKLVGEVELRKQALEKDLAEVDLKANDLVLASHVQDIIGAWRKFGLQQSKQTQSYVHYRRGERLVLLLAPAPTHSFNLTTQEHRPDDTICTHLAGWCYAMADTFRRRGGAMSFKRLISPKSTPANPMDWPVFCIESSDDLVDSHTQNSILTSIIHKVAPPNPETDLEYCATFLEPEVGDWLYAHTVA